MLCLSNTHAQKSGKREVRGAWITTFSSLDWPTRTQTPNQQRTALLGILDHHRITGINTIYFQVRSQSDALYPSSIEPWSYDLTGAQGVAPIPAWDPLQFALEESRRRGFEFHAWINPFRAVSSTTNSNNTQMFSPQHISKTHPEWLLTVGTVKILNPGLPQVRAHIQSVVLDIVRRYDVDGIHFDDYFYPSGTIDDNAAYTADPRGFPNTTAGRANWRRDNINLFIRDLYDSIRTIKPWVKFGVSPSGIYRSSTDPAVGSPTSAGASQHYSSNFADSKLWLQQGWVDYIAPQLYWHIGQAGSDYALLVPWWNNNAFGRHIYIGIAAYKVNDANQGVNWANRSQIPNQVRMNRSSAYQNIWGGIYFRTQFLRSNPLNFRDSLRLHFYNKPALQPTMPWRDAEAPLSPTALTAVQYQNDSVVLKWKRPQFSNNPMADARQFVIYRSTNPVVDTEDPSNLLAITVNDTTAYRDASIAAGTTYYYTVTSADRFHNESLASNTADNLPPVVTCPTAPGLVLDGSCSVALPDYRQNALIDGLTASEHSMVTLAQVPAPGTIISGRGSTTVTITATDKAGNTGNCSFAVERIDNTPPVITGATTDRSILTVPNHKMRTVELSYTVTDNCGPVTNTLSVSSNEPITGTTPGDKGPDWEIINANKVRLRAERAGNGTGRIYTITITSVDAAGNSSSAQVTVLVPHDHADITSARTTGASNTETIAGLGSSLKVLPNPSTTRFQLVWETKDKAPVNIRVVDLSGKLIEKRSGLPSSGSLSLGSSYRPGVYFIEVWRNGKVETIKVVKE